MYVCIHTCSGIIFNKTTVIFCYTSHIMYIDMHVLYLTIDNSLEVIPSPPLSSSFPFSFAFGRM